MGEVVNIGCVTRLDLDPDPVLENLQGKLEGFVLVGYDKDGEEFFASTYASRAETVWLLQRASLQLLRQADAALDDGK